MTSDFVKPNGIAFSVDESRLYIADTGASHDPAGPRHIRRFSVRDDGSLAGGEVFATCGNGLFDGFRVDTQDRVWASAADGVHCFNRDGRLIGKVILPEVVANLTFGGPRRNRMFVCATTSLYSVYLTVTGAKLG